MTFTLPTGKPSRIVLPPRIIDYGSSKIGKTTFASDIDGAIFLDIEGGSGTLAVTRIEKDRLTSYRAVLDAIEALYTQQHEFTAVVIDSVDWLESLIFAQVAAEAGRKSIEDIGYGAGYVAAVNLWKEFLSGLDALRVDKGMVIVLIAHDQIKRFDSPVTDSYDRHQLKLHAKSAAIVTEWADVILFARQDVYIDKKEAGFNKKISKGRAGDRVLHTVESPAYVAGNRYGLPDDLPLAWGSFIEAFNAATQNDAA